MYRIKTTDKTLYTDAIRYIRLHKNGCYVACEQDEAEGICAKVHENMEEVGTVLQDTVLALSNGVMTGAEPVCEEIDADVEITTAVMQEGQNAIDVLSILLQAGAITNAQATFYRAIIEAAMQSVEDDVAVTAVTLFPEWREGVEYAEGMRVKYNDVLYKVLTAHTSQADWTPDAATSLFAKVLIPDENVIYPWEQPESTNPYMNGDKVTHNGKTWVSTTDGNVWEPGVYGWEEIV